MNDKSKKNNILRRIFTKRSKETERKILPLDKQAKQAKKTLIIITVGVFAFVAAYAAAFFGTISKDFNYSSKVHSKTKVESPVKTKTKTFILRAKKII